MTALTRVMAAVAAVCVSLVGVIHMHRLAMKEDAIQRYVSVYEHGTLADLKDLAAPFYLDSPEFQARKSYFMENVRVTVGVARSEIRPFKAPAGQGFTLQNVSFLVEHDGKSIKLLQDISFVRDGLFNYYLMEEDEVDLERIARSGASVEVAGDFHDRLLHEIELMPVDQRQVTKQIEAVLSRWRLAWVTGDLDGYMSFYSPQAAVERVTVDRLGRELRRVESNKVELYARMQTLFERYNDIEVRLLRPSIRIDDRAGEQLHEVQILVSVGQVFVGRGLNVQYQDYGTKDLHLRYEHGAWKILNETWELRPGDQQAMIDEILFSFD